MDADEVTVQTLYDQAPEDFIAARDAAVKRARAAGDAAAGRVLKGLRRPSTSAWLVNRLTVGQPVLLQELLALGPALASAQAAGDAAALRALSEQRRTLVGAVADAAGQVRPMTGAVRDEVVATLEAALADPASADAVRSGRLVRALSYAGFGPVDLSDAVAAAPARPDTPAGAGAARPGGSRRAAKERPAAPAAPAAPSVRQRERARAAVATAERAAHDAAGRLDDAVRSAEAAERARLDAAAATATAERAVHDAQDTLEAAGREAATAARAYDEAQEQSAAAVRTVDQAQSDAAAARTALDVLRRS